MLITFNPLVYGRQTYTIGQAHGALNNPENSLRNLEGELLSVLREAAKLFIALRASLRSLSLRQLHAKGIILMANLLRYTFVKDSFTLVTK